MSLSCRIQNVDSSLNNLVAWDRAGVPLGDESGKYELSIVETGEEYVSNLIITAADTEDFTSYGCAAHNRLGDDYATIDLILRDGKIYQKPCQHAVMFHIRFNQ